MVYVFVIKCENTSVGEDFKELCVCVRAPVSLEPGVLRSAGMLTETNLRLKSSLQLLMNDVTTFTTQ